jgi:dihydroxy-acid dehydratase
MASLAEALGMMPANSAAIPAVDADRLRMAEESGRIAVELMTTDRRPSRIITERALENALRILLALGGSTNALIHLTAIAGRLGLTIDLRRLNELSDTTPVLVDLKPTGVGYMEDLHAAGGIPAVMRELRHLLHLDCQTVTGETIGDRIERARLGRSRRHTVFRRTRTPQWRACRTVWQHGATWRRPKAVSGQPFTIRTRRPRSCVQLR